MPDKGIKGQQMRPDNSVGQLSPKWLKKYYPERVNEYKMYWHKLPDGKEIEARQYKSAGILPLFIEHIDNSWLPERAYGYFKDERSKSFRILA